MSNTGSSLEWNDWGLTSAMRGGCFSSWSSWFALERPTAAVCAVPCSVREIVLWFGLQHQTTPGTLVGAEACFTGDLISCVRSQ